MTANDDGVLVVGARCTDEDCDWGPGGAANPDRWRLVERAEHDDTPTQEQREIAYDCYG